MFINKFHRRSSVLLIIMLVSLSLSGCVFKKEAPEDPPPKITINPPSNVENDEKQGRIPNNDEEKPEDDSKIGVFPGDRAPDFSLMDREGNEIKLSDLKGKVVFVNFWTTWCGFCTYEMPFIQEVYEKYKDEEVIILAVDVLAAEKIGIEEVNEFLDENGFTFPVLYDMDGSTSQQYKVRGFPTTYIIDKEGYIADFVSGAMEKDVMMEKIENVLNQ